MKKYLLFLFCSCLLQLTAQAQETDEALVKLANDRIPVSMQNFSFFETFGTFIGRQLDFGIDTLSPLQFRVMFRRDYKDVDSITLLFTATEEGYFSSAMVTAMYVRFKSSPACAAYLKLLGKPATATRWDFYLNDQNPGKGVQVYKENDRTIRIKTFTESGG